MYKMFLVLGILPARGGRGGRGGGGNSHVERLGWFLLKFELNLVSGCGSSLLDPLPTLKQTDGVFFFI